MTDTEKIEKRRLYQRLYYRDYRRGKKALKYVRNLDRTKKIIEERENIMKKISLGLIATICLICFSACDNEPKILYQSESVEVVREGNKTAVYDLLTDNEYNYKTVRVKRSDGFVEAYTAVDTDTIKIEVLPCATLRIYDKSAEKIITIRR